MLQFQELYRAARDAGLAAAAACNPTPMVVGHAKSLFSNEIDYAKPVEVVADGVCGFAWIIVKPGNSKFANWLKKEGYGRPDTYYGGVCVWVSEFNQSMQKKEAYARAFARVLGHAGIKAYSDSRMD